MAMELIATTSTVGGAAITFTNIPQDGKDLVLVSSLRNTGTASNSDQFTLSINGTGTGSTQWPSRIAIFGENGTGVTVSSTQSSTGGGAFSRNVNRSNAIANSFGYSVVIIPAYTMTVPKVILVDGGTVTSRFSTSAELQVSNHGARWVSTDAVTSLTINTASGSFAAGSVISLYKVS